MRDPYEVLEISKNASMDEIKAAYKRMIKKYHPDQYQNNPLADLAQEKLKEVNEAYDYLCKVKGSGFNGNNGSSGNTESYSYGYGSSGSGSETGVDLSAVRSYIDMGNLDAAATILSNSQNRNAEWYFLSGMVAYRRGWYDQALNMVQQAASMEPSNFEYQRNLQALRGGNSFRNANPYGNVRYGSATDDACCRACEAYLCLDCLCDCF